MKHELNTPMRIGLLFLVIASLSRWFLARATGVSEHVVDPTNGFLYGVSIASMLLGLRRNRCSRTTR